MLMTQENKMDENQKKEIQEMIDKAIARAVEYQTRKRGDTPTDDLQLTPRKYVNMFGSVLGRPQASIIGQQYFLTDTNYPIFRNSNNAWVSATGSVVA